MTFDFYCKNCDQELTAEKHMIGSKLSCPACEVIVPVPDPSNVQKLKKVSTKTPEVTKSQAIFFLVVCILSSLVSLIYVLSLDPWAGRHSFTRIICYSIIGVAFISGIFLIKTLKTWEQIERN